MMNINILLQLQSCHTSLLISDQDNGRYAEINLVKTKDFKGFNFYPYQKVAVD